MTRPADTVTAAAHPDRGPAGLSFAGTLRSEWIKLLSLGSTWWVVGACVVVAASFGLLQAATLDVTPEEAAAHMIAVAGHGAEIIVGGYSMTALAVAVLGALAMTAEYSTGTIRATLGAVPTRLPVLAAKAVIVAVITTATSVVGLAVTWLAVQPVLAPRNLLPELDDPVTWQLFGGSTFFLVASALLALGLGSALRSTAGTVTAAHVLLFVLPGILQFVAVGWVQDLLPYLPLSAAAAFLDPAPADVLAAWRGVAVVGIYAAAALVAGAVSLHRRDA
ncbi:ABC transporter permease subunit [Lysobacter korlensis]|uniref:ABC transporter permease subunit n=1 Tax=Lysobacter korlensis TaxID=553636 RepID=A0ABV6RXS0_9GAMM